MTLTATMLYIAPSPILHPVTLQKDSDLRNMNVSDWAIVANENRMDTNSPMQHLSHRNSSRVARARATMAKHGARKPHTFGRGGE